MAEAGPTTWIIAGAVLLAVIATLVVFGGVIVAWLGARSGPAPVALLTLVGMRLRKANVGRIVREQRRAAQHGLSLTLATLEEHERAGGHSGRIVAGLIAAEQRGLAVPWETAAAIDQADRDLARAVEQGVNPLTGRRFEKR